MVNQNGDNINFVCRSNCSINAGAIVKEATSRADGNGGGSKTFAQGGGKTIENIDDIFNSIKEKIKNI